MSSFERVVHCSFCHKLPENTRKIISSPNGYDKAYICDECVALCIGIIEEGTPKKPKLLYGVETENLARMESLGIVTLDIIHNLHGSVIDFFLQLKNLMASAQSKLGDIDRTELGQKISEFRKEISQEVQSLEDKKKELNSLEEKLAKITNSSTK